MAHDQIQLWLAIIKERKDKGLNLDEEKIFASILARDSHLSTFHQMEPNIQNREAYFIKNSIKGMVGFING